MANQEQLEILKQGVDVWNKWIGDIRFNDEYEIFDLSECDLSKQNLINCYLVDVNLTGVNLVDSNLMYANLEGSNLSGANLARVHLEHSNLTGTNLSRSNMRWAKLQNADLRGANLTETLFAHAFLGSTVLHNIDLSKAELLEQVNHRSASIVSTNTLRQSKGKIPEKFLRGCGLSDLDIEFAKLADPGLDPQQVTDITYKIHQLYLGEGIQYYSCFISYSNKDYELAQRLHDDLQNNGVRCWFAPEDLKIGDLIRPTIDRQIRLRDKLLVIISENSVKSEWVGDEVEGALEEEQKGNRSVLFPIRLDGTVLNTRDDWAAKIKRRRHIGDFSNWRDKASYQKAFERLLRDLKATSEIEGKDELG